MRLVAPADLEGWRLLGLLRSVGESLESRLLARPVGDVAMKQEGEA